MMTGAVSARFEPTIQCLLTNDAGVAVPINFLIDTGFNGYVALPIRWIQQLGLKIDTDTGSVTLADHSTATTNFYQARILWDDKEREIDVIELDGDPLIGTALLYAFRLTIEFDNGGNVALERFLF